MKVEPHKEHAWLQTFVGDWSFEHECSMGPGQPPMKSRGSERVRSIGGLWVMGESQGSMPDGGPANMIITLGYDPQQQRFVGAFVGSMMTHLWVYNGTLDATGKVLTLDTEGPTMASADKMTRYQDIVTLESDDHRVLRSRILGDHGQWQEFMVGRYQRVK